MVSNFKNPRPADPEPDVLALNALAWLSGEPELLSRFLALSGLQPGQIAAVAREPAFLGGVLDFIVANEADLLRFAAASDLRPEAVADAWRRLSGGGLDSGQF